MAIFSRKDKSSEIAKAVAAELAKAGMAGSPYANSGYSNATPAQPTGAQGIIQVAGQATPMPRPGGAFGNILGPAAPLLPSPLDPVLDDTGRAVPRKWEYPVAANLNLTQTAVPFGILRSLTDQCDIIHRCIEIRIAEIVKMEWSFTVTGSAIQAIMEEENVSHAKAAKIGREKYAKQISELQAFWQNPYVSADRGWAEWITEFLWQHFAFDGVPIYPRYNLGKKIIGFDVIDAATIKVLLDNRGDIPHPPAPAYQQILWGFPRGEFTASEDASGDYYAGPGRGDQFISDQLAYFVRNRRTWSPYGFSSVEQCIPAATLYLERQTWMRQEFTEGATPKTWMRTNSAELDHLKLAAFERVLNDKLAGSTAERHRVKVLPEGFDPVNMPQQESYYKPEMDEFIIKRIASCFGVSPSQLGVVARAGLGGGKGHQEGESDNAETVSKRPMENFLVEVINSLCRRFLDTDPNITFVLDDNESGKDEQAKAAGYQTALFSGQLTINDIRGATGMPLFDMAEADEPMIVSGGAPTFLKGLLEQDTSGETVGMKANSEDKPAAEPTAKPATPEPTETPAETDPGKAAKAELVAYKRFAAKRVTAGKWRDFVFTTVDAGTAELLNAQGRELVEKGASSGDNPKAPTGPSGTNKRHYSELPGHDDKQRIADYYSPLITKAISGNTTGVEAAVAQALAKALKGKSATPEDKAAAHKAAADNIKFDPAALKAVLSNLYGDAGMAGTKMALDQIGGAAKIGTGIEGLVAGMNWDKWKPGNPKAALEMADGRMRSMLTSLDITLKQIAETTQDRIGNVIADGISQGLAAREIAAGIYALLDETSLTYPDRGDVIAITESNRAFNGAAMDSYAEADLPGWEWITYDNVCDECEAEAGEHAIGDDYPPLHPNCRCAVVGMAPTYSPED